MIFELYIFVCLSTLELYNFTRLLFDVSRDIFFGYMTFEVDALRIWLANRHRLRDGLTLERFLMQFECFVAKMSVRNFLWWCSPRLSAFFWLKRNQCKCMHVDHVKTLVWYQKWLSCLRESAQLRTVYNQNILTFLMLGSLLNMASPASAEEKDDFITTLAKWTKAGSEDMKVWRCTSKLCMLRIWRPTPNGESSTKWWAS